MGLTLTLLLNWCKMKITYDKEARAMYIQISNKPITKTIANDTIIIDYGDFSKIIGIEIIGINEPKIEHGEMKNSIPENFETVNNNG